MAFGELDDGLCIPGGAYVLLGDGVECLTDEHRALIAQTATALAGETIRVVPVNVPQLVTPCVPETEPGVEPALETAPEPVPVSKAEFHRFALNYGYPKIRAGRVWNRLVFTERKDGDLPEEYRDLPTIRYLGSSNAPLYGNPDVRILDLRTIYDRLVASECQQGAWNRASKSDVEFLVHIVNEHLKPDPPLPYTKPTVG